MKSITRPKGPRTSRSRVQHEQLAQGPRLRAIAARLACERPAYERKLRALLSEVLDPVLSLRLNPEKPVRKQRKSRWLPKTIS